MIQIKRIYEEHKKTDGIRVLVDRLWPRGVSREKAHIDEWPKEIAPSPQLRKWFGHDPEKWDAFRTRYLKELKKQKDALKELKKKSSRKRMTLLYAAYDIKHNNAVVLKQAIENMESEMTRSSAGKRGRTR